VRLGLSAVAANELIHNAVIDAYSFRRITTTEDLNCLIKKIHRENQGSCYYFTFIGREDKQVYLWLLLK